MDRWPEGCVIVVGRMVVEGRCREVGGCSLRMRKRQRRRVARAVVARKLPLFCGREASLFCGV